MENRKMKILVDGDADIPPVLEGKVAYVPQYVIYNGQSFKATKEFMMSQMEKLLSPENLSTSMPSSGDFEEAIKSLSLPALAIHVSSGISSTYASIMAAAESLGVVDDMYLFDTKTAAAGIGNYVYLAYKLIEKGMSVQEVYKILTHLRDLKKEKTYAVVGDVRFASHGGRVKGLAASAARLMHFMIIVSPDENGHIEVVHKTLGRKKAINYILGEIEKLLKVAKKPMVGISHAWASADANHIGEYVKEIRPDAEIFITYMNATLIAHGGKGTVSVSVLDKQL